MTRLHIAEAGADLHARYGGEGMTVCGLVMAWAELWVAVERRPGDYVCGPCEGRPQVPARQLALVGDDAP